MRNSLLFAAAAVPLRLAGALGLALLLHPRFRGVGFYRTSAYLPTVIPDVAYALLWLWLLNPLYGPINVTLRELGFDEPRWLTDPADAQQAIVLMSVFQLGEGFLVALATRQALPRELYELASLERASVFYVFRRVTLPLMAPVLLLLAFRDTIFSFQANFVPALIVTEGGPPPYATTYLPLFAYRNAFEYLRYGYAAAATLAMLGITIAVVVAQYLVVRRWQRRFACEERAYAPAAVSGSRRPVLMPRLLALVVTALLALGGCGGEDNDGGSAIVGTIPARPTISCSGRAMAATRLPDSFPEVEGATYTSTKTAGPTEIVDGYYEGRLRDAYRAYKAAFRRARYYVIFDELEANDSEVTYLGGGRTGQVALRRTCREDGRISLHITSRPE